MLHMTSLTMRPQSTSGLCHTVLTAAEFETPLGPMLAISDETRLLLLEFIERRDLEGEIDRLQQTLKATLIEGQTQPLRLIEAELKDYFAGALTEFKTPTALMGTAFQTTVWEALKKIPSGETRSYAELAIMIGRPGAFRAVAKANSTNQLAIIVPCHRVINSDGKLGGYAAGVTRKQWLLNHESKI